jgi:hypothetical protein
MSSAVEGIVDFLSEQVGSLDADALDASADEYLAQLAAVDAEVTSPPPPPPPPGRYGR